MASFVDYQYEAMKAEGYRFTDIIGQAGLEATYEQYLRGQDGILRAETDRFGNRVRGFRANGTGCRQRPDTDFRCTAAGYCFERALAQVIADLRKKAIRRPVGVLWWHWTLIQAAFSHSQLSYL